MINQLNDFNWYIYKNGYTGDHKLIPNCQIKGTNNHSKCFSREPYAQKLYNVYSGQDSQIIKKDLIKGDCVLIKNISNISNSTMDVEITGGLIITIDLNREKRFLQLYGFNKVSNFTDKMQNKIFLQNFINENIIAYVIENTPSIKISLWQGHLTNIRVEFMEQINEPSKAYVCTVKEANKGGFFVEVQGVDAFMPGSLAAANKINDFSTYIGKEVIVMIEDFLKDMNSFIVSHKKYIAYILPKKLLEIDTFKKYKGTITGASKYGIFVEFEEFFTGLLHISKMSEETQILFKSRYYKPGDEIEFYVGEITKDDRIILTEEDPQEKLRNIQKFILDIKDKVVESEIAAIMNFGIIVTIDKITGLIPLKEFKKNRISINNFVVKDKINIMFEEFRDEKIVFKLPNIKL